MSFLSAFHPSLVCAMLLCAVLQKKRERLFLLLPNNRMLVGSLKRACEYWGHCFRAFCILHLPWLSVQYLWQGGWCRGFIMTS